MVAMPVGVAGLIAVLVFVVLVLIAETVAREISPVADLSKVSVGVIDRDASINYVTSWWAVTERNVSAPTCWWCAVAPNLSRKLGLVPGCLLRLVTACLSQSQEQDRGEHVSTLHENSLSSVKSVTVIPETRQDVLLSIELAIISGGEYFYIRVIVLERLDAFWRSYDTDHSDLISSVLLQ